MSMEGHWLDCVRITFPEIRWITHGWPMVDTCIAITAQAERPKCLDRLASGLLFCMLFGKDKKQPGAGAYRMCIVTWRWGVGGIILSMQHLFKVIYMYIMMGFIVLGLLVLLFLLLTAPLLDDIYLQRNTALLFPYYALATNLSHPPPSPSTSNSHTRNSRSSKTHCSTPARAPPHNS